MLVVPPGFVMILPGGNATHFIIHHSSFKIKTNMLHELSTIIILNKTLVIREQVRANFPHQPNFAGTGKALTGVLKPGENLQDFCTRRNLRQHTYTK